MITFYYLVQSGLGLHLPLSTIKLSTKKKLSKLQLESLTKTHSSILSLFNSQEQKEKKKISPPPFSFFFRESVNKT